MNESAITISVSLYGNIAVKGGGLHVASIKLSLSKGSTIGTVLKELTIKPEEKGYLFKNAILFDAPGLNTSLPEILENEDHLGIFSTQHMWPYQYRDGVRMSESLKEAMKEHGSMSHSYRHQ
ncbi:MAG: hypothetical protein JEZ06_02890 [Anaerolineaceae bacterium]|nr:hypothetical protein [Anaerolineaceae bacterium]